MQPRVAVNCAVGEVNEVSDPFYTNRLSVIDEELSVCRGSTRERPYLAERCKNDAYRIPKRRKVE